MKAGGELQATVKVRVLSDDGYDDAPVTAKAPGRSPHDADHDGALGDDAAVKTEEQLKKTCGGDETLKLEIAAALGRLGFNGWRL